MQTLLSNKLFFLFKNPQLTQEIIGNDHQHLPQKLYDHAVSTKQGDSHKDDQFFEHKRSKSRADELYKFFSCILCSLILTLKDKGTVRKVREDYTDHPRNSIRYQLLNVQNILKKIEQYHIDLSSSWMVGDTTVDIQTGKNAGLHTALVLTGEAGNDKKYDVTPDLVCKDLWEAVEMILKYKE